MAYLLNCWYAGALSAELSQQPLLRTLLDSPVVFFRTESGLAVALDNVCSHRFAPLNRGKVIGEAIRCPYHGLQFGPNGQCVSNPIGKGAIPAAARVKSYPVAEVNGIVWLWFGDATPDESKIIRFECFEQPDKYASVEDQMGVKASYTLVSDNLLDLSHAEFLHPALATDGFNRRVQFSASQEGEIVTVRNWRPNEPITTLWRLGLGDRAPENVDHRSVVTWHAPAVLKVEVGATFVGRPDPEGVTTIAAHLITPETEKTCHYFWKLARDFRLSDGPFSERLHDLVQSAFATEDRPMIEAQQENILLKGPQAGDGVLLRSDEGAVRARRILKGKIANQTAPGRLEAAQGRE